MLAIIENPSDLERLKSRAARRNIKKVVLNLPHPPMVVHALEKRINRGLRACGCATAAVFLCAAIVSLCVVLSQDADALGRTVRTKVVVITITLMSITLIGKIVGLLVAELNLRCAIREATAGMVGAQNQ
jgi:hypothetical protein